MNILVTGANGQLGNCIRNASRRTEHNFVFTDVAELDITNQEAVLKAVHEGKINVIINCAAYTNVDRAEDDAAFAEVLNVDAVRNLAVAAKDCDAMLIHISTDYVFGGSKGNVPRTEEEPANPTGIYGLTKLHGEQAVIDAGCKYLIFRTAWLYSEYGKNFVKTMLTLTATKPELKVVFDQCGTPTYAQDLADAIIGIIESGRYVENQGIYHFSNEGVCSWYDFTQMIAYFAGNKGCKILPCHSSEFPSKVVRPAYSVLDKTKIKDTFGIEIPYWTVSLNKCLKNIENNGLQA